MASFKRQFTEFPGYDKIAEIESIVTIDQTPPSTPLGAGTGVVCIVGEFEDGQFNAPLRVYGADDIEENFGLFGHVKDGQASMYPVAQRSGGSTFPWNGNAYIALKRKRFAGLVLCRVDSSAGAVQLSRLATMDGAFNAPWSLTPGDVLRVSLDGAAALVATFTAATAQITAAAAVYPVSVGGLTLELVVDRGGLQVVTFTDADLTLQDVIDRVNSAVAAPVASDASGQLRLSSLRQGWGGAIEVVGGSALSQLGLPAAVVQQELTGTVATAAAGAWTASLQQQIDGQTLTYTASYTAAGGDSEDDIRDGLLTSFLGLGVPFATFAPGGAGEFVTTMAENRVASSPAITPPGGGAGTFVETTPAVVTLARGTGNVRDIAAVTLTEFESVVSALTGVTATHTEDGLPRLQNTATPGTGTISIVAPSPAAAAFGFPVGVPAHAGTGGVAGTVPSGTLLRDVATGTLWITMERVDTTADNGGPYTVRVRPAVDDDTAPTAAAGDIAEVIDTLYAGFAVTHSAPISRLNAPQMDARYMAAIESVLDVAGVAHDVNILLAARSSPMINRAVVSNAVEATRTGHRARKAVVSPPVGTAKLDAMSSDPGGVGEVRNRRAFYVFPGLSVQIPEIAARGASGGVGFSRDGVVDVVGAPWYASVRSILPPEENAGQELSSSQLGESLDVLGMESAYDRGRGGAKLTIDDYKAFRSAGIIAPRQDRVSGLVFHSDVTTAPRTTQEALTDAKRQFMADFINDTLSDIGQQHAKKLNKVTRRRAHLAQITGFLEILLSPQQPDLSRIAEYAVKDETPAALAGRGFQVIKVAVRMIDSADFIVYRSTVGTTVQVDQI